MFTLGLLIHFNLSESISGIYYLSSSKICKLTSFTALFPPSFFVPLLLYILHLYLLQGQQYTFIVILAYNLMLFKGAERKENKHVFIEFVIVIF